MHYQLQPLYHPLDHFYQLLIINFFHLFILSLFITLSICVPVYHYQYLSIYQSKINWRRLVSSVTRIKLPNVYISCPKMISQQKLKLLTPLQKLPKNEEDFGKIVVAKGFKKLLKVQ